jgi:phenylalanyl-tRNA synthetase beta chain
VEVLAQEWFAKKISPLSFHALDRDDAFWENRRAARLALRGRDVGVCGFPLPARLAAFGIKTPVVCIDLAFEDIAPLFDDTPAFIPLEKYPSVVRDIAFVVARGASYQSIEHAIRALDPLIVSVQLFDVFEGPGIGAGARSLALHIRYASRTRTLNAEEVEEAHGRVRDMLSGTLGAVVR